MDDHSDNLEDNERKILVKRILGFLSLEIQWIESARQIWMSDVETGDVVTVYLELDGEGGLVQERPLEVPRDSALLNDNCDGNDIAEKAFLEMIWMVKKLSYGMDIETLEPKKVLENPFFKLKSAEEIAMKLDLLAGDVEKEKLERRRCETML